jgi:translation initiation factor 2B subunit (eIF-2B alpha/beta/delta family)
LKIKTPFSKTIIITEIDFETVIDVISKLFIKDVELINQDTKNGAAQIAENCLSALKRECLRQKSELKSSFVKSAIQLLLDTHPMATIENALIPVYERLFRYEEDQETHRGDIKTEIELIFATRREQMRICEINTIKTLVEALRGTKSLLTFSHSSTITTALSQLAKENYCDKEIYILESRPLMEGEKTADSIAKAGFQKTYLGVDFALNEFSNKAEVAVLGADTVYSSGQILNKIGSATIAKTFQSKSKDVIFAASSSKLCSIRGIIDNSHKAYPTIPARNPKEVSSISRPNLTIWNKYFEIIEPEYTSSLIMDTHTFLPPINEKITKFLEDSLIFKQVENIKDIWNENNTLIPKN